MTPYAGTVHQTNVGLLVGNIQTGIDFTHGSSSFLKPPDGLQAGADFVLSGRVTLTQLRHVPDFLSPIFQSSVSRDNSEIFTCRRQYKSFKEPVLAAVMKALTNNKWLRLFWILTVNIVVLIILIGSLEFSFRVFSDINFLGNSKTLFAAGKPKRNNPGIEAISYGEPVFIDSDGYRVPDLEYRYPNIPKQRILFLGDSIAFGPGVREEETFIGLLRNRYDDFQIINSSVIGYSIRDYEFILDRIENGNSDSMNVILVYCLNDISKQSATEIDRIVGAETKEAPADLRHYIQNLKKIKIVERLNSFLIRRSIFYLWLKGALTDPAKRYYLQDRALYEDDTKVKETADVLFRIKSKVLSKGKSFNLVISPYEFQLRSNNDVDEFQDSATTPQNRLTRELERRGVEWIDARQFFEISPRRTLSDYFLPYDPMHLSKEGHLSFFHGLVAELSYLN